MMDQLRKDDESSSESITLKPLVQGSADPSTSLVTLWNHLEPALNHILLSPSNTPSKAPAIDFAYYTSIYTAVYNHVTKPRAAADRPNIDPLRGRDLYGHLDEYFTKVARENYLGAPQEDSTLLAYYVTCFNRYTAGVQSVNRLMNYLNRHYVNRNVGEGKGWLFLTEEDGKTAQKRSSKLEKKRRDELRKWGYEKGGTMEMLGVAEACAEAASSLERIVPVSSLGHRRWRTEVLEPLLSVPESEARRERRDVASASTADNVPRGRLARSVEELCEGSDAQSPTSVELAKSLSKSLRVCGIRTDHPLLKELDKVVSSSHRG